MVFFSYDFGRFCRNLLHLLYVLELVWQKFTNGHGFSFLYKNVNHGLKLYTFGVQMKHYMLVSERYIWADGRVVINNNGLDLINSAGILAIHFFMMGLCLQIWDFIPKSPNFYVSLLANYGTLRKISYFCPKFRCSLYIARLWKKKNITRF